MFETDILHARHYIVSPISLQTWFSQFVDLAPEDSIVYSDETECIDESLLRAQLDVSGDPGKTQVIFCSSHKSLVRDCELAERLRTYGYNVTGVNRSAVLYGQNKQIMKGLFNAIGVATPAWTPLSSDDTVEVIRSRLQNAQYITKEHSSTSGEGNFLGDSAPPSATYHCYAEVFEEGDEYSVVALSSADTIVLFPPVWKGATRRDLSPPYKRLRVCPFPPLYSRLETQMHKIAKQLIQATGVNGLLEVEYIVTPDGRLLVIEVNPRLAGTVLMSAMATETRIFNLLARVTPGPDYILRSATCYTIEMPWQGHLPEVLPRGVHFTTRMAVSGSSYQDILAKIQHVMQLGVVPDAQALAMFTEKIMPLPVSNSM